MFPPYPQQNQLDIDTDMFGDSDFFTQDQLNQFDFDIPDLNTGVGTHGGKLVPHPSQQDQPDFGQFQSTFGDLTNTQPDSPEDQRPHEYTQTFDHTAGDQSMGDFSRSHGQEQYQSDHAMSTQYGEEAVHSTRAGQATPSQADVTVLQAPDVRLPNQSPSSKPNAPDRGSRGMKRPFPGVDASTTASPTPPATGGAKRMRFGGEALAKSKTANQAAQAFVGIDVANEAILDALAYVDEATSIQAAKDRLARTAPSIEYHRLNIQSDDVNVYTHEELMPIVFQRLIDSIMSEPGVPSYVDDDRKASFTKKHGNRYKLCCSLLETKEQQLDAIANFELLVAAIKELSTHGIAIADLDQEEYNKSGKQKIVTRGDMLVDQELTFLQRIDRIIEVCGVCKWTAVDVLKGSKSNKEDLVANPDLYAKRKYTAFKNNDSRDSRLQDTKAAKAEAAMLRGEGVADDGGTTMTKAKRGRKAKAKSNFLDPDTVEGAAMQDDE